MNEYPIQVNGIVSWFRSKEQALRDVQVTLAKVIERQTDKPAVQADFDSTNAVGRITGWVSGEIDFEVLRRSDGNDVFFRHEKVPSLESPNLENAYNAFVEKMIHPD